MLLLFGGTPKDLIHQFAAHKDTVHSQSFGQDGAVIDQSHHHCSFIDFQLMPFDGPQQLPFVAFATCADFLSYTVLVSSRLFAADVLQVSLRGPPVVLV